MTYSISGINLIVTSQRERARDVILADFNIGKLKGESGIRVMRSIKIWESIWDLAGLFGAVTRQTKKGLFVIKLGINLIVIK